MWGKEKDAFITIHVGIHISRLKREVSWGAVNLCLTPLFNLIRLYMYMAVTLHSCRNRLFLWMNQQPSVSSWQLQLMGFRPEPQRRRASNLIARRRHHSATEVPKPNMWLSDSILILGQPVLVLSFNAEFMSEITSTILTPMVWRGLGSYPRPSYYEAKSLTIRAPSR